MNAQRIGIVSCEGCDDKPLQRLLVRRGYLTDTMEACADVVAYCRAVQPLALIMNAGGDASAVFTAIAVLRKNGPAPLIVVAGPAADPECQIKSLAVGADDFVAQPVQPAELLARLDILLGRNAASAADRSWFDKIVHVLTSTEREVFATLQDAMPETLSREEIMWRMRRQRIAPDERTPDVYISHIRKKLVLIDSEFAIETVRGKGFRLVDAGADLLATGQPVPRRRA